MLVAASDRVFGPSRLRSLAVLERRFRAHFVVRDRLVYDTRFAAPARGGPVATIYLVIRGNLQIDSGEVHRTPCGYLLAESEFERVVPGGPSLRTWGDPAITLDLMVRSEDVRAPIGVRHGPLALSDATWSVVRDCTDALARPSDEMIERAVPRMLGALADDGVISASVGESIGPEPEQLARLWTGVRPLFEAQATSASILQIKKATGLSLRQLARDIKLLIKTFGLPGEGFRDSIKVMRLRTAVILLSSPGATATEVARQVGYKSLEALGRALREVNLPSPSVVQEQVLYERMPGA